MENRCVCCGEIIPEGYQVCEKCSNMLTFDEEPVTIGGWKITGNDLISREVLIKEIENYRVRNYSNNDSTGYALTYVVGIVKTQPTAFDKEKVIEQLKEEGCIIDDDAVNRAIEIIEKGGIG